MIRFTVVDVERPFFRELPPPATNTAYTYRDPLIRYGDAQRLGAGAGGLLDCNGFGFKIREGTSRE